ncbi:MAG: alpha/beta fold hydrolase [Actinobacteria bacterium]|nr:alpha/beta fold hydrolase [Actinomycetota bacterium]
MAKKLPVSSPEDEARIRLITLPDRFRPDAADGLAAEWELRVGDDTYTVVVSGGECRVRRGRSRRAATWITADPDTWLALDSGSMTGVDALLARRLSIRGNLDLAVRLLTLFDPWGRPRGPTDIEQVELDVEGLGVSAYVTGQGPPVLLLHGLGGTKVSWLPLFASLAPHYRLIVPDLPGHGESDKPRTDYTPRFYAKVARQILSAVGAGRAAVVGNSLGGRVALELAVRSPDRVSALALLGPAVPGFRVRYILGFTRVVPTEIGAVPFVLRERWMMLAIRRLFGDPSVLPEDGYAAGADEFIRVYRDPAARMAFFDSLRHILTESPKPFWPLMRRVRVPTLIVWGTRDRLVPVRLASRLHDALPSAELTLLPGVGHVPQFEAPIDTNRELVRFLGSVPPWS